MNANIPVLPIAGGTLVRALLALVALVASWLKRFSRARQNRRQATVLARLDRHMLADIGITRADLRNAFSEPFWDDPDRAAARTRHRAALSFPASDAPRRGGERLPSTADHSPGAPGDVNNQTAEPSRRPLDPGPAIIPSRGRIPRPPAPPAGAFFLGRISARTRRQVR
jgi:uncharacterized protein YjiS (DUF1127 family)